MPSGEFLLAHLSSLGYSATRMEVSPERFNVYATVPGRKPDVVFSTHMDTVPPFIPSSEDSEHIYGRGACDAKGIIAAQIAAAERLRQEGDGRTRRCCSSWAKNATARARPSPISTRRARAF